MIIIIPIGGTGSRYKKNGYNRPKALIKVFGKPILFWLLETLNITNNTIIYIPYNKEYTNYRFESLLHKNFPSFNFKFLLLENDTRGAAETLNIALKVLDEKDQPIISLDSDNFYMTDIMSIWNNKNSVLLFKDQNKEPLYSYVELNEKKEVTKIIEKVKISDYACCGGYAFTSYKELIKYTQFIIENNIRQKDEFYTSTVINEMLKDNHKFTSIEIPKEKYICLGTPLQLKYFYNNFPKKSCLSLTNNIHTMRICFDLDNTLVTFPIKKNDYTTVKPITKNIQYLRYLKSFGHTIIIYTARRMKTHNGNIGKLMCDIGKITFDTLEKFSIPYDEIYFGKPQADVYIDDLGLNCFDNMEKELGFYTDNIKPRDFNELNSSFIEIYKKSSNDLSGEIFYYQHIPNEIKDMFPLFINYDENNTWYEIEKINGLTSSTLYVSELLTIITLKSIMDSIKRIQSCNYNNYNNDNINIYQNYSKKLEERYKSYDYSSFHNHTETFNYINNYLIEYQKMNKGKISVIHGDTVLTNIIINEYDKIKFIDMRGKMGDKLTICGDWLYDWAKLYQSLIGYDYILMNKEINTKYQESMIDFFVDYFVTLYSEEKLISLKMITKSLLFTLIPLHNNENCSKFYNLISSKYLN
jgi:capsule biosynthesis phosphatase